MPLPTIRSLIQILSVKHWKVKIKNKYIKKHTIETYLFVYGVKNKIKINVRAHQSAVNMEPAMGTQV